MGGGGEFVRAAAKMAGSGTVAVVRGSPAVTQFGQLLLRGSPKPASVFVGPSSPVPRVVFGAAPSFEEAAEATTEVKEAWDRYSMCLSSSLDSNSKLEPESCLAIQTSPQNSVPQHAIQAFSLLKESAEAQTIVASIVSDPNVWNAMLSNEVLKSFLQSYKALENRELSEELEERPDVNHAEESKIESRNVFHETIEYIKTSIDDMLATATSFLQKVFESSPAEVSSGNDKATSGYSSAEIAMGSSIMGLVIVVVAVLVTKRN